MREKIGQLLLAHNYITIEQLDEVLLLQKEKANNKIGELLISKKYINSKKLYEVLSEQYNVKYYDELTVDESLYQYFETLTLSFLKGNLAIPFKIENSNLLVAFADFNNLRMLDDFSYIFDKFCKPVFSDSHAIIEALNHTYDQLSTMSGNNLEEIQKEDDDDGEDFEELERDLLEASDDEAPVIRFVNRLLYRAVKEKVSDIHIEAYEKDIVIRFRIDGVLKEVMKQPKNVHSAIASRIKIMGGLNIAEKRLPQSGRIKIKLAGRDIDIRLSTLPAWFGERIVMRLLDQKGTTLDLTKNGFSEQVLYDMHKLIKQPHGIILVTGPTGSGKSTTLYSALSKINSPELNIITVENPVEYQIRGISQVQVNPKINMSFAAALREILRQDPDVVMIGEIRDKETADIAMQAAMTGHLVLSTLHTNDTASSPTRLVDMGVEPYLVGSTVIGILAQRLVRRLCNHCKTPMKPTEIELNKIGLTMADVAPDTIIYKANGCTKCMNNGYSGRTGIYELMLIGDEIKSLINQNEDANKIKNMAKAKGMKTLREDGALKVLQGITSVEEVLRVTQDELV